MTNLTSLSTFIKNTSDAIDNGHFTNARVCENSGIVIGATIDELSLERFVAMSLEISVEKVLVDEDDIIDQIVKAVDDHAMNCSVINDNL